uniref:Putative pentatricopeptide repeat protein n=1 Tax=Helianthus annuus TaxID=4232 RepID=A0A251SBM2_HELAN
MLKRNIMSCNILIGGFVQTGELDQARKLFDDMSERNIAMWNAKVAGLAYFECNEEALRLLFEMRVSGFYPNVYS